MLYRENLSYCELSFFSPIFSLDYVKVFDEDCFFYRAIQFNQTLQTLAPVYTPYRFNRA